MTKRVIAIISLRELRDHRSAKRNAQEEINRGVITMNMKTAKSYEEQIEYYKRLITELENDEDWDTAGNYIECLAELIDEYEYLKSDESAFQKYLLRTQKV